MKIIFIAIFILSFFIVKGQSDYEKGIIKYGVEINNEAFKKARNNDNKKISKASLKRVEAVLINFKKFFSADIPFLLLSFNKNKYILKPIEILPSEGLKEKYILRSNVYYGNTGNDTYIKKLDRSGNIYRVSFKEKYNWEIKNQYKNIQGFKCRKALLTISKKIKIIAWFTPQIPVTLSPVKYYGLPGAILEVTTPLKHIYAMNIEFKDNVKVEKPTGGVKLSQEEYLDMISPPKRPD